MQPIEFQERIMEVMSDKDLVDVHRMDKVKEICAEHAEDVEEMASMQLDDCQSCKL